MNLVAEAHAPARVPQVPPNLIAIASGKGGVGKTWFAVTLTHAIAARGKHVLLFDGDLGLANVDVQLGIKPEYDLGSFLNGQTTLAEAATHYEPGGFDIIVGRSGSGSLAHVAPSRLAAVRSDLQLLGTKYDCVILDMGAGIERTVRSFTSQARSCLIVTTDEPTAITDAYAFIKLTVMERPNADVRIVINMANSAREGEQTYRVLLKACQSFLKIEPPLAGIIRRDSHVRESIRNQTSLLTRYPNSEAAADVRALASTLIRGL